MVEGAGERIMLFGVWGHKGTKAESFTKISLGRLMPLLVFSPIDIVDLLLFLSNVS